MSTRELIHTVITMPNISAGKEQLIALNCWILTMAYAEGHHIAGAVLFFIQAAFGYYRVRIKREELKEKQRGNKSTNDKETN